MLKNTNCNFEFIVKQNQMKIMKSCRSFTIFHHFCNAVTLVGRHQKSYLDIYRVKVSIIQRKNPAFKILFKSTKVLITKVHQDVLEVPKVKVLTGRILSK